MTIRPDILWHRPWLLPTLLATVAIAGVLALIIVSASGRALFPFAEHAPGELAEDEDIRAWIAFDKASYLLGDLVTYRVRLLWRPARVAPDLETFETSIGFYPFDHRESHFERRRLGGGVREYVADYTLQVINVDAPASYELDTATVYYTRESEGHSELHALRANPPIAYVGEFFPGNIATIGLRPPKAAIDDAGPLRRTLMFALAMALAVLAGVLLWQRGRRRPYADLSRGEQLWRDRDALAKAELSERERLLAYESLFTEILELRSGIAPFEFWSRRGVADGEWQAVIDEAHDAFDGAYRPAGPSAADVETLAALTERLLAPVIAAARLERETHAGWLERLQSQPWFLGASAALLIVAIVTLWLAAAPSAWLSDDIRRYNAAVAALEADTDLREAVDAFAALGDAADDARVRSAAFYNLGTLLVDPRLTRLSREQYRNFLQAIFLPDITLDLLLHDLELDAEFELITLLTELTRQYVQAEQALEAAIRAGPPEPDMGRNLELLGKTRRAIGRSLAQLVTDGEAGAGAQQMLSQTVIDLRLLMEAELPDDYAKLDEGKDDSDYFILEQF